MVVALLEDHKTLTVPNKYDRDRSVIGTTHVA